VPYASLGFDAGWFWLDDGCNVVVRDNLPETEDYDFIRDYNQVQIETPEQQDLRPHPIFLQAHRALLGVE
jgi:hypothetical protein